MHPGGTRVLSVDPQAPGPGVIAEAAAVLAGGGLVGFATETYYGLGADARRVEAVRRVFLVKGRPAARPLLVLVDSLAMLESLVEELPSQAQALIARHWPGPLTIVLRSRSTLPAELGAGTGTIGVRIPGHPVARALVRALGAPVTASSANPSGGRPPTTAKDVLDAFDGEIELVLDAGRTPGGTPSTVVDATVDPPRVLRAGAVRL